MEIFSASPKAVPGIEMGLQLRADALTGAFFEQANSFFGVKEHPVCIYKTVFEPAKSTVTSHKHCCCC